jgi:tetratricopeptide (TPR) repeat protein
VKAAREARNASLGARAVNAMARRVLEDGNPWLAHDMLRHALRSLRDLPGDMTALLYTTDAWTCATLGDYGQMALCLEEAAALTGSLGSLFGAAELAGIAGACYETLASRVRQPEQASHLAQAEACITEALRLRDPFYARSRVLDLAGLANVRLGQGEPEEAMRTASRALITAAGLRSDRAARRVHSLAIRALDLYPAAPAVTEFAELVRSRLPVALPA